MTMDTMTMDTNNPANQSKLEASVQSKLENVHERVTIGLGFTSDWLRKWRGICKPTLSLKMKNQIKSNQNY